MRSRSRGSTPSLSSPPRLSFDLVLSELRGVLAAGPSSATWSALIETLALCPEEREAELVAYIEPQIARWRVDEGARWEPVLTTREQHEWRAHLPRGELRVMPWSWIMELPSLKRPHHALARALSFEETGLSDLQLIASLDPQALRGLEALDLGSAPRRGEELAFEVSAFARSRRLHTLGLSLCLTEAQSRAWASLAPCPTLRSLRLSQTRGHLDGHALQRLWESEALDQVRTLSVTAMGYHDQAREALAALGTSRHSERLPRLERVELRGSSFLAHVIGQLQGWGGRPARCVALECAMRELTRDRLRVALQIELRGVERLDLSAVTFDVEATAKFAFGARYGALPKAARLRLAFIDLLEEILPGSPLARSVTEIRLGPWWTEPLAAALADHDTLALK